MDITSSRCVHILMITAYLFMLFNTGSAKTILVLGGTGLLGSATMERLIDRGDNLMVVNRGNRYWDTSKTIIPFVTSINCNRRFSLKDCPALHIMISGEGKDTIFDAVIDFSSFTAGNVSDVLKVFHGRIERYIFISSDSTYEVCMKNHTNPTVESDSVRPVPGSVNDEYIQKDVYGSHKLEGEEVLEAQKEGGVPFVVMRLPDIIGPRDNTNQWWMYQLWIKLSDYLDRPVSVPDALSELRLSLVYSYDVANMITALLDADMKVYNQVYNFAFEENPTLTSLLLTLAAELDRPDVKINVNQNPTMVYLLPSKLSQQQYNWPELSSFNESWSSSMFMYPSVSLGIIDTSKAKRILGWNPTSLADAVRETVKFFEEAMITDEFEEERIEIKRALLLHFSRNPERTMKGIDLVYHQKRTTHQEL